MDAFFPGAGTALNVVAVLLGAGVGMAAGHRLPDRVRGVVTDSLGLLVLVLALVSALEMTSPVLVESVGRGVPVLIILGSLVLGGITGSVLQVEQRLGGLAARVQRVVGRADAASSGARERFIEGWLTASLLFCVGPLTILGSLSDGLGLGIDQLVLKSALDFFAAIAFASTFGLGVMMSAVSVAVVQGALTLVGVGLGAVVPDAHIAALTAVGGILLLGIALRLLSIRQIPVADLLPALVVAPVLVSVAMALN